MTPAPLWVRDPCAGLAANTFAAIRSAASIMAAIEVISRYGEYGECPFLEAFGSWQTGRKCCSVCCCFRLK